MGVVNRKGRLMKSKLELSKEPLIIIGVEGRGGAALW